MAVSPTGRRPRLQRRQRRRHQLVDVANEIIDDRRRRPHRARRRGRRWRTQIETGDFVADISRAKRELGWPPQRRAARRARRDRCATIAAAHCVSRAAPPRVVYLAHTLRRRRRGRDGAEPGAPSAAREFERAVVCIDDAGADWRGNQADRRAVSRAWAYAGTAAPVRSAAACSDFLHRLRTRPSCTRSCSRRSLYGRFAAMLARVPIVIGTEVNIYERKQPLHRWPSAG